MKKAAIMASKLCDGFILHDQREREKSIDAFATVDILQFPHLDESTAREAAIAYVDALWAKDSVENSCRDNGHIDPDQVQEADWSEVREAFARRAEAAGINPDYADLSTEAWIQHKAGGDYWTPIMHAQMLELRTAMQDPDYPHKPRSGQSGFGPEPLRYALGVELHDMRRWGPARAEVMTAYFERILEAHRDLEAVS